MSLTLHRAVAEKLRRLNQSPECRVSDAHRGWNRLSAPDQFTREFLQLWTRKESSLKAFGVGLLGAATDQDGGNAYSRRGWRTSELALGPDHVDALTVEGGAEVRIANWRVSPSSQPRNARHPLRFELADSTASAT